MAEGLGARLLLVEDDEGDALLVRACLGEAGFGDDSVAWRRTLLEGLSVLRPGVQCVLLDLGLPDAEGLQALQRTVAAAPDTPVIVLTGRHDNIGTEALAAGAEDYLVKDDITAELLDRSIRYALERKRAQRTTQRLRAAELNAAEKARLERGLLPTPLLRSDHVVCATHYRPGRDHAVLGGDFYDMVELPDGRVRAVIGDVMGHGPDEAAIGVHLRVAWRTLVLAGTSDTAVLPGLAQLLAAEAGPEAGFVTACDVTIEPDGTVAVRVAGHPAPVVFDGGKASYLDVEVGPPLGLQCPVPARPDWSETGGWPQSRAWLGRGASLVLYTDGLLDAYSRDSDDSSMGVDEFVRAVDSHAAGGASAANWLPALVGRAPAESDDDIAVIVVTVREEG